MPELILMAAESVCPFNLEQFNSLGFFPQKQSTPGSACTLTAGPATNLMDTPYGLPNSWGSSAGFWEKTALFLAASIFLREALSRTIEDVIRQTKPHGGFILILDKPQRKQFGDREDT